MVVALAEKWMEVTGDLLVVLARHRLQYGGGRATQWQGQRGVNGAGGE